MGRSVDLEKDFIGRDALLRRRGHADLPVRVGLSGSAKRAAREGDIILAEGGAEVGRVTSGTMSPTLGVSVAFARVPADVQPGDRVEVDIRGKRVPATVCKLPFVRHGKAVDAT